jgi:ribonucleoside-diphosphate reductase beta chain
MKGTAEQLQYIMRDEVLHASFGIRVVKQILFEEEVTLHPKKLREMWDEAEACEEAYAGYILRDPILGYSKEDHMEQFRFVANRRARQLGLEEPFPGAQCALPWLDEQANLRKEKNFFETRVTEYQTGGALTWD